MDPHVHREGRELLYGTGAELSAPVVAPGPESSARVDGIAGVTARVDPDEGDVPGDVHLHWHIGVNPAPYAELTTIVVPPRPDATALKDGDRLAVLGPAPTLEDLGDGTNPQAARKSDHRCRRARGGGRRVSELAGVAAPAGVDVAVRVEEGVRSGTRRDRHVGEGKLLRAAFDETG